MKTARQLRWAIRSARSRLYRRALQAEQEMEKASSADVKIALQNRASTFHEAIKILDAIEHEPVT